MTTLKMTSAKAKEILYSMPRVLEEEVGEHRWTLDLRTVLKLDGKLYEVLHARGKSELQDDTDEFYDEPEVTFYEVEAYEKTVTDYRRVST